MLWVGHSSTHDEDTTKDIARVFYALSRAFNELEMWYEHIIASQRPVFRPGFLNHPRFFPFATRYPLSGEDFDAGAVEFEYIAPLQKSSICVTFLAEIKPSNSQPGKRIVIKFAQRYCPEVHRLLASRSMAPDLLYCGRIDASTPYRNWKLVVMDFFDGEPSYEGDRHKDPDVYEKVAAIIGVAHGAGFVLGDVRPPNVLISGAGAVKMIDFDWAGREGAVRYPAHMSSGLWVPGVAPAALVEKAHDTGMLARWFRKQW